MENKTLDKIIRLGSQTTNGGRWYSIYAHIQITEGELRITGVEGPLPSGNALGSCGQIRNTPIKKLDPNWTPEMLSTLRYIWDRWHLNHLRSMCEHQQQLGQTFASHPLSECAICGYTLGSQWLKEELPQSVITFLENLPTTNKIPAWI